MSTVIRDALAELGVKRMLLAIHDISFPSDPDEDIGRGAPGTAAAARLFGFAHALGFTGIQLGPQGQTSRSNPSPYDATIFSMHVGTIGLAMLRPGGMFEGLVDDATLDSALYRDGGTRAHHAHAHEAMERILDAAFVGMRRGTHGLDAHVRELRMHAPWLVADALFHTLCREHGERTFRDWPAEDARLWQPPPGEEGAYAARRQALVDARSDAIDRYLLGQVLASVQHARVRQHVLAPLSLALYGDLQVGYSEADMWRLAPCFLAGYAMGAPPSRTNPEGQPWNYPVLDPDQLDGAARELVARRLDVALARYDSIRVDHPHGLVCPWVYRTQGDPAIAVRQGARLYESPDLPDHPALARFAIARADQLVRSQPRHADGWVDHLDEPQVVRYARLFEVIAEAAARHGRAMADVSCEVLSTMPLPLSRVLARYGLGRWRITQKANLDDESDVYRTENARQVDWMMLGNHDTPPIRAVIASWTADKRDAWMRHLGKRLGLTAVQQAEIAAHDGRVATAMLAELLASDAENVSIFWADLFGETERFNAPGTISEENWSLRLPHDFEQLFAVRQERGDALDVRLALALALEARGSTSGLAPALRVR